MNDPLNNESRLALNRRQMLVSGSAAAAALVTLPRLAMAAAPSAATSSRTQRNQQVGEDFWRRHQAMTAAHVAGRKPVPTPLPLAPNATFFLAGVGEHKSDSSAGEDAATLKELQMYWRKIPDFGVKRFHLVADEQGWGVFLYWGGTEQNGKQWLVLEADRIFTDADFRITRYEIIYDNREWLSLAAYVNDRDPATFSPADYFKAVASQPG